MTKPIRHGDPIPEIYLLNPHWPRSFPLPPELPDPLDGSEQEEEEKDPDIIEGGATGTGAVVDTTPPPVRVLIVRRDPPSGESEVVAGTVGRDLDNPDTQLDGLVLIGTLDDGRRLYAEDPTNTETLGATANPYYIRPAVEQEIEGTINPSVITTLIEEAALTGDGTPPPAIPGDPAGSNTAGNNPITGDPITETQEVELGSVFPRTEGVFGPPDKRCRDVTPRFTEQGITRANECVNTHFPLADDVSTVLDCDGSLIIVPKQTGRRRDFAAQRAERRRDAKVAQRQLLEREQQKVRRQIIESNQTITENAQAVDTQQIGREFIRFDTLDARRITLQQGE